MAVLGLHFCAKAFSSCSKWGPIFITVCGPLTIKASLVVEQRLQTHRLSSCGSQAYLAHGIWDPPRPGLEPVSPAMAGRFSTTAPPGKSLFRLILTVEFPEQLLNFSKYIFVLCQAFVIVLGSSNHLLHDTLSCTGVNMR